VKKLFYIGEGSEGDAGSGFILEYLKKTYGDKLDENLRNQIYEIGNADLTAVSDWLGEKPFFMRATATSLDTIASSFLANILVPPLNHR
jgi:hypothetical protein